MTLSFYSSDLICGGDVCIVLVQLVEPTKQCLAVCLVTLLVVVVK